MRHHLDCARLDVPSIAVLRQQMHGIGHEEHHEGNGRAQQAHGGPRADVLVVDIVYDVERAQRASEEHHSQSQHEHPGIEQGVEAVRGVGPMADGLSAAFNQQG